MKHLHRVLLIPVTPQPGTQFVSSEDLQDLYNKSELNVSPISYHYEPRKTFSQRAPFHQTKHQSQMNLFYNLHQTGTTSGEETQGHKSSQGQLTFNWLAFISLHRCFLVYYYPCFLHFNRKKFCWFIMSCLHLLPTKSVILIYSLVKRMSCPPGFH